MLERQELPRFKYHPNLYELDILERFEGTCECCGEAGEVFYQGMYTSEDVNYIRPWCIASGRAAEMFHGRYSMLDSEWRRRVKAYVKLGYRTADGEDLGLVGLEGRPEPVGHLFAGRESSEALMADLADSSSRVIMSSSWARFARVRAMLESLSAAIGRGVAVEVVLREPRKPSTEWWQVIAALRDLGCEVRLANSGKPLDVVVIDGSLVWCGDVAPLAYPRRDNCTLRFANREVAAELAEALTGASNGGMHRDTRKSFM